MYENRVYPGIPELLGEIGRMGWSAYVVTSKPRIYARKILDHFELGRFFVRVHGERDGREAEHGKASCLRMSWSRSPSWPGMR